MSRGAGDSVDIRTYTTGPRPVIALGIPSFGMVHLYFAARLLNMRFPMNTIVRQFFVVGKEVGDARNEIVARALAIEEEDPSLKCSHVLFLDDDVLFHPDVLNQLLSRQRPIVSGLYYTKTAVPTPLVLHGEYDGTARSWTPGDLVECWGHGMGLTLIQAEVFRRVRDEGNLSVDRYGHPAWFKTTRDEAIVRPDGVPAVLNQTEDMHFLMKARELGYTAAVDTSAPAFGWHLDTRKMIAYPQRQWTEFTTTGRVTWQTDNGPVVWENAA